MPPIPRRRSSRLLAGLTIVGSVALLPALLSPAHSAPSAAPAAAPAAEPSVSAKVASDRWIDGGDDLPCVDDETCLWISGCILDGNNNPVYPNRNGTHVGGGPHSYADQQTPDPDPDADADPDPDSTRHSRPPRSRRRRAPPRSRPRTARARRRPRAPGTPAAPAAPAAAGSGGSGGGKNGGSGTTDVGDDSTDSNASASTATPSATPTVEETAEEQAEQVSTLLAPPTVTVDGTDVTVTWQPPTGDRTGLVEYRVALLRGPRATVAGTTTTHTFTDVRDGVYRATVSAVYASGSPETSGSSDKVTIGQDPTQVRGTVTVAGDLTAGERVVVAGRGFARNVPDLSVELHSDPVLLAEVQTDGKGRFEVEALLPETVEAGDHHVVVLYDGVELSSNPVTVAAAVSAAASEAPTDTAAAAAPESSSRGGLLLLLGLVGATAVALGGHAVTKRRRGSSALADTEVEPARA